MILTGLNNVREFVFNPTPEGFKKISTLFEDPLAEEYLWEKAAALKQTGILKIVADADQKYLQNKIVDLLNGKYENVHFNFLRYLVELAVALPKEHNDFKLLDELIKPFVAPDKNTHVVNDQIYSFITEIIMELPSKFVSENHIEFLSEHQTGNMYIRSLIEEKLIRRAIIEANHPLLYTILDKLVFSKYSYDTPTESNRGLDGYNISKLVNELTIAEISRIIGSKELLEFYENKLATASVINTYNFSCFNIATLQESNQILDSQNYDYLLVNFARIHLELFEQSNETIERMLGSKIAILRRLAIHYINYHYKTQKALFWNIITNPLDDYELKHEVYSLIEQHRNNISSAEFTVFSAWIDKITFPSIDPATPEKEIELLKLGEQKEYLTAFVGNSGEYQEAFNKKYSEISALYPHEFEHPGFNSYVSSGRLEEGVETTSFNSKDIEIYLSQILAGFPNISEAEGLNILNRFKHLLSYNADFAITHLDDLKKAPLLAIETLPRAFERKIDHGDKIDWVKVLNLISYVISNNEKSKLDYFVGYSSWLIRRLANSEADYINQEQLDKAKDCCLLMLKLGIQSERLNNDPMFDILNSPDGKILEATTSVLFRNARINKETDVRWYQDIKEYFTEQLNSGNQTDALIWAISRQLPWFASLDAEWTNSIINSLFPKPKAQLWILAMQIYHQSYSTVYKSIFIMLSKNGHYDHAIELFTEEKRGIQDVFKHIAMSFIADWPGCGLDNSNSLINKVINKGNVNQIDSLISSLVRNKNFPQAKILSLWSVILEKANLNPTIYNIVISLIRAISKIDENVVKVVCANLTKLDEKTNAYDLVSKVLSLPTDNVKFKALILMALKENNLNKYYLRGDFETLTKELYHSDKQFANQFVENMAQKRLFQLLDIYNQNNQN